MALLSAVATVYLGANTVQSLRLYLARNNEKEHREIRDSMNSPISRHAFYIAKFLEDLNDTGGV